jgi:tetratricopeptide (TPR) repeat protein
MATNVANTVVDLNNNALTYFLSGDYQRAIFMLKVALENCTVNVPLQCDLRQNDGGNFQSSFNFISSSHEELPTLMDCEVDTIIKEKSARCLQVEPTCYFASSPNTAYSMYNRALVLSRDLDDDALLVRNQHRTHAIILYNLALVHHNIGVHLGVSAALPHALRLYEMALETIDRGANFVDVQKLLLALLNNMGNIHTHLFHFENTRQCLSSLRVVLAASSSAMAMDDDFVFFFLNSLFQGKELCFAPAA